MNLPEALERIKYLEERLAYFESRGQKLMDLTYNQILQKLEDTDVLILSSTLLKLRASVIGTTPAVLQAFSTKLQELIQSGQAGAQLGGLPLVE